MKACSFKMKSIITISLFIIIGSSFISCAQNKSDTKVEKKTKVDLNKYSKAVFASGCFWCVEGVFESITGVEEVISGYAGGKEIDPTYEQVGSGQTGHAEAIEVYYDSTKVNYNTLLRVYFSSQDVTQVNGQGPDRGSQYRSIIFYSNDKENQSAVKYIEEINKSKKYDEPVAATVDKLTKFYPAEDYHQDYILHNPKNPYVNGESIPRIKRAQSQLKDLLKPEKILK